MASALVYGGLPTPLLTKLGPSLIFPKESIGGKVEWEADELERIDENVVGHLDKLAAKSLEDGEDLRSNWKAVEHWFALLHWLHLDLDLKEIRQEAF